MTLTTLRKIRLAIHITIALFMILVVLQSVSAIGQSNEEVAPPYQHPDISTPPVVQVEEVVVQVEEERSIEEHWSKETSRAYAREKSQKYGWYENQFTCLEELWHRESNWDHTAQNPTSSAFGIPQMLKMDPSTPPDVQIKKGLKYIEHRYGSPCEALKFHDRKNWY